MTIKKFEADSLEKALLEVKKELGSEALVLNTETVFKGIFRKKRIQIIAGIIPSEKESVQSKSQPLNELFPYRKAMKQTIQDAHDPKEFSKDELSEGSNIQKYKFVNETYESFFNNLGFNYVNSKNFAKKIISLSTSQDRKNKDYTEQLSKEIMLEHIQTLDIDIFQHRKNWSFIGLGGVGKSSLAIKLALLLKKHKYPLQLVNADSRKLLAKTQLKEYARKISVPCFDNFNEVNFDAVTFIDTPSFNTSQKEDIQHLIQLTQNSSSILVLDAQSRYQEMMHIIEHSKMFFPIAIVFTKLDCCSQFGPMVEVLKSTQIPLLGCSVSQSYKVPFKFFYKNEFIDLVINPKQLHMGEQHRL